MNQNLVTLTYLSMKTRLKARVLLHSQTSQLLVIHKYRHKGSLYTLGMIEKESEKIRDVVCSEQKAFV